MSAKLLRLTMISTLVAIGVVISPILRIEGMCPTAHLINVFCGVLLGPYYAFAAAVAIGSLRMVFMGIPPLALTGAVFGAFLSGILYRVSQGKLMFAVIGEMIGTGLIGSLVSYPVMKFLVGRGELSWFFYTPTFVGATFIGGSAAYILLILLSANGTLAKFQKRLGVKTYGQ